MYNRVIFACQLGHIYLIIRIIFEKSLGRASSFTWIHGISKDFPALILDLGNIYGSNTLSVTSIS